MATNWYELTPRTNQKSFYGKAKVIEKNGNTLLQSYDTIVCGIDKNGIFRRYWSGESATTMRHVNSFLGFVGVPGGGVKWWRKQAVVPAVFGTWKELLTAKQAQKQRQRSTKTAKK